MTAAAEPGLETAPVLPAIVASVRDARRSFGDREVLAGIDLHVAAGEFVALIGRSGSGKSTLLRVLAGLDREATGEIFVSRRRMLAFQDARLLPWLRVLDNVVLGLPKSEVATARALLADVGLEGRDRSWPSALSGGEAQRVALARALVRRPELLLLDEPFGSLDAITRRQMQELLLRLHASYRPGTLLVTHDIDEALALADRVHVLADGAITLSLDIANVASPDDEDPAAFAEARRQLIDALR